MKVKKHLRVSLTCSVIVLFAVMLRGEENELSRHLNMGSEAATQGRYASAKAEYEAAIAIDPSYAEAWYELGLLYGRIGDFANAELYFRQAIKLDPQFAKAHCRLGQTLVADPRVKQDWTGAVAEFRAALKIQPDYPEAESFLGLGLTNLGFIDEAIATLRSAIQLNPKLAAAHLNLATALQLNNQLAEAVDEYQKAMQLEADRPETEVALGSLLVRLGKPLQAEQEFRSALSLNPDLVDAHYNLARLLKTQKNDRLAAIEFAEADALRQREPDRINAVHMSNESLQYAADGHLAGAIDLLRKAIVLRPDYGVAHYNLGLVLADSGNLPAAKKELIKAASLLQEEAKVWFDLGRVLMKLSDRQDAYNVVAWATQLAPANTVYRAALASIHAANSGVGKPSESHSGHGVSSDRLPDPVQGYQPPYGASSDTPSSHVEFASQLQRQGDLLGAAGELLRALALKPDFVCARKALAAVYVSLNDRDKAILEYRKLLMIAGADVDTHLAIANLLMDQGRTSEAANEFQLALKLMPDSAAARSGLKDSLRHNLPQQ